jgi:5-methylcytosine-specific restriction endonuclease McrA
MRRIIQDGGRMPPDGMTLDHIIDLCDGGSNSLENLVLACHSCNQKRSKETSKRKNQEQKELLSKYVIGTIDA